MVYTIGGLVQFRSEDGAVWVSEDIGVTLTVTTSRLLEYLLLHRGRVIFRDEILQNVWDAHGLKTSGNSLNKYISDLRSAFRNLGFQQELIVTVPKVGFMIAEGVHIEAEEREEKKRAVNLPATAQASEPHRERLRRVSVLLLGARPAVSGHASGFSGLQRSQRGAADGEHRSLSGQIPVARQRGSETRRNQYCRRCDQA